VPDPFITVTDLSDYLGRDVTADDGAVIAVDAACDTVRDISERIVNRGTATITLDGTGTDALPIPNRYLPVSTAGTVTVNGGTVTDYVLSSNGMLFRGSAGAYPRSAWPAGRQNVTVTIVHGYEAADLPRSIKMVALSHASRLVVQGVAVEETVGPDRIKYAVPAGDLTSGEERILRKYRHTR
jgi:hypothetical protein